jgi:hypothetical protein
MSRIIVSNFQKPIEIISDFQYKVNGNFDADFSPANPVNQEAAKQRGLHFDSEKRAYVDEDGCLMADEFG